MPSTKPKPKRRTHPTKNEIDGEKILLIIGKGPPARGIAATARTMVTATGRNNNREKTYAPIIPHSP